MNCISIASVLLTVLRVDGAESLAFIECNDMESRGNIEEALPLTHFNMECNLLKIFS